MLRSCAASRFRFQTASSRTVANLPLLLNRHAASKNRVVQLVSIDSKPMLNSIGRSNLVSLLYRY
jgi:hypothetical protein